MAVIGLVVACLMAVPAAQVVDAWSTDPSVNTPVCTVGRYQAYPVMVSDGSGGAIIAWQDGRKTTQDWDVYVQRLDPAGASLWTANGVAVYNGAEDQWYPAMVSDGSGGAIIAWSDARSGSVAVYAQRVNSAGTMQWEDDGVAVCAAANLELGPDAIVSDGSHGAIIVWVDWCTDGDPYCYTGTIYAQRLDVTGTPRWTAGGVAVSAVAVGDDRMRPEIAVASDGAGGAIVTWQNYSDDQWDVLAQRVDAAGVLQWGAGGVVVAGTAHKEWWPAIVSDGSGGAVIAWTEARIDFSSSIRAQRVNASGVSQWAGTATVCDRDQGEDFSDLAVTGDGSHGIIIAWSADTDGGSDIRAQRVDSSGAARWAANGLAVCTYAGLQYHTVVAADGSGGAVIAWHDERSQNPVYEIKDLYAQRVNAEGAALWTQNGTAVCHSAQIRTAAALISDGRGGAILAWNDQRTAGYENEHLYAQKVNAQGQLGDGGAPRWDISGDGKVDYRDLAMLGAHYGQTTSAPYPAWDINQDGAVNYKDLAVLGAHYGESY